MDEQRRAARVNQAIDFTQITAASEERYLLACIYYQQALRMESPHECTIPALHISELILNLAKCLEMLFGSSRDKVRETCRLLGYTDEEIETQIVPILVIRSNFDIAHPVGTRMLYEYIETVHQYAGRSLYNVRALLIRVGTLLSDGKDILAPLDSDGKDDRIKLCERLREHMTKPMLTEDLL